VTEPTGLFVALSSALTLALVVIGVGVSALWFRSVLRRFGIGLRFAPA